MREKWDREPGRRARAPKETQEAYGEECKPNRVDRRVRNPFRAEIDFLGFVSIHGLHWTLSQAEVGVRRSWRNTKSSRRRAIRPDPQQVWDWFERRLVPGTN